MSLFHKKPAAGEGQPQAYDFAKMVKQAREQDPGRFAKLQAAFKRAKPTNHKQGRN